MVDPRGLVSEQWRGQATTIRLKLDGSQPYLILTFLSFVKAPEFPRRGTRLSPLFPDVCQPWIAFKQAWSLEYSIRGPYKIGTGVCWLYPVDSSGSRPTITYYNKHCWDYNVAHYGLGVGWCELVAFVCARKIVRARRTLSTDTTSTESLAWFECPIGTGNLWVSPRYPTHGL